MENRETLRQEMRNEIAELKKELAMCEKQIAKRDDKQSYYLSEKADILSDIEAIQEELDLLNNLPNND